MKTRIVLIALIAAFAMPSAFAAKVSVMGAADYYGVTDFGGGVKGGLGFGGGLLFELPMGKSAGFELGGIFVSRKIEMTADLLGVPLEIATNMKTLNLPGAFRFMMGQNFSMHAGGYYELYLESGGGNDYGATAGFRMSFPGRSGTFFIEPRFNYGLKKEEGSTLNNKSVLGLVGFTFGK